MITDFKRADEEDVVTRMNEAKEIGFGGVYPWESVDLSPEEMKQQVKDFFSLVKFVKPYTSDFLGSQKHRVNELCYDIMHDEKYYKKESYLKDVEKKVQVKEPYYKKASVRYDTPRSDLLVMAT